MKLLLVTLLICLGMTAPLGAFPPAPYYTLYGMVRDQVGQTLNVEGANIVLLKDGVEIGRAPITSAIQLDQNYELKIRIDQNRAGTALYSEQAVIAQGLFSLVVEMNGSLFRPIEVSGNLVAGKGGERIRLDLNLGEDLDGDGLPDVWEQWQLYQAGYYPDENGNWPIHLINRDGDFDGDGTSNYVEYIAGTFAGDATEKFTLAIKEKLPEYNRFEFFAIAGKTYTIESSTDAKVWTRVSFSVTTASAGDAAYTAQNIGILSAFTAPNPGADREFFRLKVR